ncbi:wax ester/triacylglycerol synthase family O-acyltransferase [Polaromonas sp.]|uniref:wax ester/triacylglycerol synthase family O-acyltransferase n=1 Tax=Polaromonas sp. TaxID=1869339 RepID=UPI0037505F3A
MKSLTGLDATFLYLETPEMPMHVGSLNLCELPADFKGSFHKAVKAHIASRIHLAPIFSRKLLFMPFDIGHPLWVEAESVDIDFHIRRVPCSAQKPMTLAQAHTLVAKLHSELIDRAYPLWEFYVFDAIKLPSGERVGGFFSKIHHAALDGRGGVMLANAMLDVGPVPREVVPPDPARRGKTAADLKVGKMIGSVFSNSLAQVAKLAKSLPSAASTLGSTLAKQSLQGGTGRPKMPMKLAPKSPFNTAVTQGRVFVAATVPLAECKAMGKAVGGSFNDVALWICSTALRSYLAQHNSVPAKSLVAAMPVSLREAGASDASDLGNQVSMSLVELGTHIAHPLKRMNAIMASTAKVKSSMQSLKGLLPTDYPSLLAPWLVGGAAKAALNAYGKTGLASRLPMVANLAISNVPGPPVPLFLAGAKIVSFHPLSIVIHGLALNITIQTYAGHVDFGIVAGKKALPHAQDLARAITAAFHEAQALLGAAAPATPPETRVASATLSGKSRSVKSAGGPKISVIKNKAHPSNASSHGTTRTPAVGAKPKQKASPARRPAA